MQLTRGANSLINLPPNLYWTKINEFREEMSIVDKKIGKIERHLQANKQREPKNTQKSIQDCIHAQYRSLIVIADKVSSSHNKVTNLKKKHNLKSFFPGLNDGLPDTTIKKSGLAPTPRQLI